MSQLTIDSNVALKKSALITLLKDFLSAGVQSFTINSDKLELMTSNQNQRDVTLSCGFKCDHCIELHSNSIQDLINELELNNRIYVLNHNINQCLILTFK